jgi:uncharacterized membrane protein
MDRLLFAVTFLCAIGAGLIGGLFFAFSSFVMTALGRVQPAAGTRPCSPSMWRC